MRTTPAESSAAAEWWHTARAVRWGPMGGAVAASSVLITTLGRGASTLPLQMTAFLLGAAAAFAVDDPAGESLAASPRSLWSRRVVRLAVVVPVTGIIWFLALLADPPESAGEGLALTATSVGFLGLGLGAAAAGCRVAGWTLGGTIAGPSLVVVVILSSTLPPGWRPLPTGDVPGGFPVICARWAVAALVGLVALRLASADPQ
jgi:hypothetical protein